MALITAINIPLHQFSIKQIEIAAKQMGRANIADFFHNGKIY